MLLFDNTSTIKRESKANEIFATTLYKRGEEKQLYKVGQTVDGNGLGFTHGVIVDVYEVNGFIYYVVEYKLTPRSRKTFQKTFRQIDINIIEL